MKVSPTINNSIRQRVKYTSWNRVILNVVNKFWLIDSMTNHLLLDDIYDNLSN